MNFHNYSQYPKTTPMPRGIDVTFYRVLWVTLVAVALTFTAILTGVFIDLDGFLVKQSTGAVEQQTVPNERTVALPAPFEEIQDFPSNEDDEDAMESAFRTKRSLDPSNLLLQIKSPKIKKILTNHLAVLLDELDEEESSQSTQTTKLVDDVKLGSEVKPKYPSGEELVERKMDDQGIKGQKNDKVKNDISNNKNLFHLAMHNILLQGIIGHMDINDVYQKIHQLARSFDGTIGGDAKELEEVTFNERPNKLLKIISQDSNIEIENKFFEELLKCQELQQEISKRKLLKSYDKSEIVKDSPLSVKMIIEITNNKKKQETLKTNSSDKIKDLIKLLYSKNPIDLKEIVNDKKAQNVTPQEIFHTGKEKRESAENVKIDDESFNTKRKADNISILDQAIADYLRSHTIDLNKHNIMTKESFQSKRFKRQIKIRYSDDRMTTEKSKSLKDIVKKQDDELYVEIETHFDGKGAKGEKKKKLVRSLIDKIQKAINSNIEVRGEDKQNKEKPLQIRKRTQNPIKPKNELITDTLAGETIEHRHLNPIGKTLNLIQPLTSVLDMYGKTWKKEYFGPGFLTVSKSLNSAEMSELDVDYNSVMRNGIPKRLQKPINTGNDDIINPNELPNDIDNATLFLKEIDGSGFTIGINQYRDEPPDKENLKMFTGLQNLIQAYHKNYDKSDELNNESAEETDYILTDDDKLIGRDINRHKRSAIKVKVFSTKNTKRKINKLLNTKPMKTKKIFLKSKRNKRHIDKIRIVASEHYPKQSKENIFLVSREDIFANRAIVKEDDTPEVLIGEQDEPYDYVAPYENIHNEEVPNSQPYIANLYDTKHLHAGLMSKYPHVFVENIENSREDFINVSPNNQDRLEILRNDYRKLNSEPTIDADENTPDERNVSLPNVDEIVNAILPSRTNYKFTLKILPKNNSNIGPGYKEIHTIINKSYNKDGMKYVSSVNVTEVSKIESINKTKEQSSPPSEIFVKSKIEKQRNQIKLLLNLHKTRIDQQLENLKMESQQLKQLIGKEDKENFNTNVDHIKRAHRQGLTNFNESNIFSINEATSASSKPTTEASVPKSVSIENLPILLKKQHDDWDKTIILSTIKQNENITREILQKIDKNTDILQSFLQKLSDKLESTSHVDVKAEQLNKDNTQELREAQLKSSFIEQIHKNYSNPIPFIYAFQQPITQNKEKPYKGVANVVYHGHLHANGVENERNKNDFFTDVANNLKVLGSKNFNYKTRNRNNESSFFIDELEGNYKILPNGNERGHRMAVASLNTTLL